MSSLGTSIVGVGDAGSAVGSGTHRLPGSLAPVPFGDTLLGPAVTSTPLTLQVALDPRDPVALASMALAVSTPGSPEYHHFLSAGQFAQLYGPTPATIAAVTAALESQGLTVGAASGTDLSLPVTATVGQVEQAFSTPLLRYRLPSGDVGYDNTKSPSVSMSVASKIQGVLGLDTLNEPEPLISPMAPHKATRAPATSGPTVLPGQPAPANNVCLDGIRGAESRFSALDADTLAATYNFTGMYGAADFGAGSTVALVELAGAGYSASDISTFADCYGINLAANQVSEESTDGGSNAIGGSTVEAELDIETVLSLAPAAKIKVYEGNQSLYNVESQIVNDDTAKIVSISWGACEADFNSSYQLSENTLLEAASLDGQSVFASSGDNGAEGCNVNGEQGADTGMTPISQAINSANGTLYTANTQSATVSVIRESNATLVATVNVGQTPSVALYDAANSELYVANQDDDSLSEVSTTNCKATSTRGCTLTTTIPGLKFLNEPDDMVLDGTTLYVGNQLGQTVAVFNTVSGQFVGTVNLPADANASALAVDASHTVYVADIENGQLEYFNGATCNATTQSGCSSAPGIVPVVDSPSAFALDAAKNELYVAGFRGNISVVSTTSKSVVTTIRTSNVGEILPGTTSRVFSIAMSPNGQDLLATVDPEDRFTNYGDELVTIDPTTNAVVSAVGWNSGDFLGQLVSDPTLNLVWETDEIGGGDLLENLNLGVNDPASQPEITGVGGTTLNVLGDRSSETVWNDNTQDDFGAGGGGISQEFTMPNFQLALGVIPGSSSTPCADASGDCREVPDVAADADPLTGYVIYDSKEKLPGWIGVGGTSAASPLWAGALAVIASADGAGSTGFGSLNPALYSLAASSPGTYFYDVTSGNNDYNDANGGAFTARAGYDMATGLGTPNVSTLAFGLDGKSLTVPGAPTTSTPTKGNGSVTVTWSAPSSTGGSAITGYTVTAQTGSTATSDACPSSTSSAATACIVSGLTNGDPYTFTVAAINLVGTGPFSNFSSSVTPIEVPASPTIGPVIGGNGLVVVNWSPPSNIGGSAITGYTVTADDVTTSTSAPNACPTSISSTLTTCTASGLTNGDAYSFTVAAINSVGTGSFSTPSTPVTPNGQLPTLPVVTLRVTTTFAPGQSALNSVDKALLRALAMKLTSGASVSLTAFANGDASLARRRALAVATYLETLVQVKVSVRVVTNSTANKVIVTTTQ